MIATDSSDEAEEQSLAATRRRANLLFGRGRRLSPEDVDLILESPAGAQVREMVRYSAVGTPREAKRYLDEFAEHAEADELIVAPASPDRAARLRSLELVAEEHGLDPAA